MTIPNPNAFTDEDLKRLKDHSIELYVSFNPKDGGKNILPALLARLEAAEWSAENHGGCALADECICDPCKAWRTSKGE